jgi:predicted Zn-dependent protease with MMP-like domain
MKLKSDEFDAIVQRAIERIPEEIRQHLDEVVVTVKDRPTPEMLKSLGLPLDDALFGLYQGASLAGRSRYDVAPLPDTIYIFQEPLEEECETVEELEEEIEITVVHEVAHFVGFSEEQLRELGYE